MQIREPLGMGNKVFIFLKNKIQPAGCPLRHTSIFAQEQTSPGYHSLDKKQRTLIFSGTRLNFAGKETDSCIFLGEITPYYRTGITSLENG